MIIEAGIPLLLAVWRRWWENVKDYRFLCQKMDLLLQNKSMVEIVSGGARGADMLAKKYAQERGYPYTEFPADWKEYGKKAGYIRNDQMHAYIAETEDRGCVMFWDGQSPGTKQNIALARRYENPLRTVLVERITEK